MSEQPWDKEIPQKILSAIRDGRCFVTVEVKSGKGDFPTDDVQWILALHAYCEELEAENARLVKDIVSFQSLK